MVTFAMCIAEDTVIREVENGYMAMVGERVFVFGTFEALVEWMRERFGE